MSIPKSTTRPIPRISLANFPARIDDITSQLIRAAETSGFFSLTDTEITIHDISSIFETSESFFALPEEIKANVPFTTQNVGWEKRGQIRPSVSIAILRDIARKLTG